MNSINFFSGDKFPQYRQALAKMQDMINLVAGLAGMGGKNFILSGCEVDNSGNVNDGVIVVNGEVIPLKRAKITNIATAKITIKETRQDVNAFNVVYPETYITREAQFASNGEYSWSEFEQIKTNLELDKLIRDITGDPPGVIKEWAGAPGQIPTDYMLCDGRDLSISEYRALYEAIGVTFGGDGLATFKLPNTGGRFSIGYSGAGDYSAIGNTGGAATVSLTGTQNGQHTHGFKSVRTDSNNWRGTGEATGSYTVFDDNKTTDSSGAGTPHENRPPYIVFSKIIKVR